MSASASFEGAALVTMIKCDRPLDQGGHRALDEDTEPHRVPHLTWIFLSPLSQRRGVASALLAASARALRRQGHEQLASTMLVGNCRSILWHGRCGFRPLGVL